MKKALSFLIAACLILVLSFPAFAKLERTGYREITVSEMMTIPDAVAFKKMMNENRHIKEWTIEIISGGGYTVSGITMYNIIKELQKQGVKFNTIVRGEADSMAAILFLVGDKRIVYEGAQVMFHKAYQANRVTGVKITPPKGSDAEKALKLTNDFLINTLKVFYDNDIKKVDELLEKTTRYSAKELHELGIATNYINLVE